MCTLRRQWQREEERAGRGEIPHRWSRVALPSADASTVAPRGPNGALLPWTVRSWSHGSAERQAASDAAAPSGMRVDSLRKPRTFGSAGGRTRSPAAVPRLASRRRSDKAVMEDRCAARERRAALSRSRLMCRAVSVGSVSGVTPGGSKIADHAERSERNSTREL